jgi:hypothetical protein
MRPGTLVVLVLLLGALVLFALFLFRQGEAGRLTPQDTPSSATTQP